MIGFRVLKSSDRSVHYGASDIVFSLETPVNGEPASPGNGVHIALRAPDREIVRRFHAAAVANGGRDDGASGIREKCNASYYRALDGNKIEAVLLGTRELRPLTEAVVAWLAERDERIVRVLQPLSILA